MTAFRRLLVCATAFLALLLPGRSQTISSLDKILEKMGDNMRRVKNSLPDFECREIFRQRISSKKGQPSWEQTVESILRVVQFPEFSEKREYKSVDGKQFARNDKAPENLNSDYGLFGNLLLSTFRFENQKFYDYKIAGVDTIQGHAALALTFNTVKGQKELKYAVNGIELVRKSSGKAWLDPDSMQVIQLELKELNVPSNLSPETFVLDYAKVDIGGKEFWMPKAAHIVSSDKKGNWTSEHVIEYADYRKFDVSTDVKFGPEVQ